MTVVTLYGRPGCCLCAEAREGLEALRVRAAAFTLREVNIEDDDELHRRLLERIPVVEIDGEIVCEVFFEQDAILARIGTLSA